MFEQAVMASEACRQSAGTRYGALIPALCGCLRCERVQMVASPDLGICSDCGEEFSVLPTVADVGVSHLPEAA